MDKRAALRLKPGDYVIAQSADKLQGYEGSVRCVTSKGGVLVEFGPYEPLAGTERWFPYHRVNRGVGK